MAVEVENQEYLYLEVNRESMLKACNVSSEDPYSLSSHRRPVKSDKQFWTNYIHDLESIWWITVWILCRFQKHEKKRETLAPQGNPLDLECSKSRLKFLRHDPYFIKHIKKIPLPFLELKRFVIECRHTLGTTYKANEINMEANSPIYMSDNCTIHKEVLELLRSTRRKNDIDRIAPIKQKAVNTKEKSESELDVFETEGKKDLNMGYEQQQVSALVEICYIRLISIFRAIAKTIVEKTLIGVPGSALEDISVATRQTVLGSKPVIVEKTATITQHKKLTICKRKRRNSQDISTTSPVKRRKIEDVGDNRRVTRSMTKTGSDR